MNMKMAELELREKMGRRRKREFRLRAFWSVFAVVFESVLLNCVAIMCVLWFCTKFASPLLESGWTLKDMLFSSLGGAFLGVAGIAGSWDVRLFRGICRRAIFPEVEISVAPTQVSHGDIVEVDFRVKNGAVVGIRRLRAQLRCTEIDGDCQAKEWFAETVFSSPWKNDFAKGTLSVEIPMGFPPSGFNGEKKTLVIWAISMSGSTAHIAMPDVLSSAEIDVVKESA